MCDPPRLPYYWSLLTSCLQYSYALSYNSVANHWISLCLKKLCHKTILKCCAGDSLSKYYIHIFVKEPRGVYTTGIWVGGYGACFPGKFWNLGSLNGWKCIRNFANLMFFESKIKAWPSPDFQRFKSLDPPPLLQNSTDDPPLCQAPAPPSPTINTIPSLIFTVWTPVWCCLVMFEGHKTLIWSNNPTVNIHFVLVFDGQCFSSFCSFGEPHQICLARTCVLYLLSCLYDPDTVSCLLCAFSRMVN